MRFDTLSDLKLMSVYESQHSISLKNVFYFFVVLLIIDLSFRWMVWVGVVLSLFVVLSWVGYTRKLYSLTNQLEKEINRRNLASILVDIAMRKKNINSFKGGL